MILKGRRKDSKTHPKTIMFSNSGDEFNYSYSNLPEIPQDKRYIGSEYKNYICSICIDVCKKPRQCKDGHLFCFSCIQQQIDHNPTCPICRQEISLESLSRNLIAEKQTENLEMWCRFHFELTDNDEWIASESGCPESFASVLVENHEKQCQFGWTSCRFSERCAKIRRKDIKTHERDCLYRTTDCQFCFTVLPYTLLLQHERECPMSPVDCAHCGMKLKLGDLESHQQHDCEEMLIRCPYLCENLIRRKDMSQHNALYIVTHLECIRVEAEKKNASLLQEKDAKIVELNTKIDILNKKIQTLSEGAVIEWKITWSSALNRRFLQESFQFDNLKLILWLYPDGDTEESKGCLSLYLAHEERIFAFFTSSDGNNYVKKLSYYFEVVNHKDESSNIRSGDISFSLYPNHGGGLMKGERRMIRSQLISESTGYLTERGEMVLRLHLYTKTLISIVSS